MSRGTVEVNYATSFRLLTGNDPFPWQHHLYSSFTRGHFPTPCVLPTGLGKTRILAVWLLALAAAPTKVPRRLVYVVNRRTVVDQSTREAEKLRDNLAEVPDVAQQLKELCATDADSPLAISTLRGEFADNSEWRSDPARPAIVVGTVDMIGSRLLFSGYGCGYKTRPLHAGFLGQDVLLVHDEAHLEPAFQRLITAIWDEQYKQDERLVEGLEARQRLITAIRDEQHNRGEVRQLHVMELTATSRSREEAFGLTADDRHNEIVRQRIEAKKRLYLVGIDDEKKLADRVAELALGYKESKQAILVFLRKLEDVEKVADKLLKAKAKVERLTGTLRGRERDSLATRNPVFARFLPPSERQCDAVEGQTVYLICTSAGEVGVNLSADHMICDLTTFDSIAQRLGRVNRFGESDARIEVVHPAEFKGEDEAYRETTLRLLRRLPQVDNAYDASPAAISLLPLNDRLDAFNPEPKIRLTSEIVFDAWALTTIRKDLPGRPPVAAYLHGDADELPETYVAWRREVELLPPDKFDDDFLGEVLEDYPLKPLELLRDRTDRIRKHLERIAKRLPDVIAWRVSANGAVEAGQLAALIEKERDRDLLSGSTVVLPPTAGGLEIVGGHSTGALKGEAECVPSAKEEYDVSGEWRINGHLIRCRLEIAPEQDNRSPPDNKMRPMRPIRTIDLRWEPEEEEESADDEASSSRPRQLLYFVRPRQADDDGSKSARKKQSLDFHLGASEQYAKQMVNALALDRPIAEAVVLAAKWHDRGKDRKLWQHGIGNFSYPSERLAKSDRPSRTREASRYRHEFGSLLEADEAFREHPDRDLILHLIAAHHGRARPHFPQAETFDPQLPQAAWDKASCEVPQRFARLQREYGRWGLAYLESLVRAADVMASNAEEQI
jgi:CRISPR-associated endonuclease/helicase Cas3